MGELRISQDEVPLFDEVKWLFDKLKEKGAPISRKKGSYIFRLMTEDDLVPTGEISSRIDGSTRDRIFTWEDK